MADEPQEPPAPAPGSGPTTEELQATIAEMQGKIDELTAANETATAALTEAQAALEAAQPERMERKKKFKYTYSMSFSSVIVMYVEGVDPEIEINDEWSN